MNVNNIRVNNTIKGKDILFICPIFHDYHRLIIDELERLGANVDFYPERKYNYWFKILNHLSFSLLSKYQARHYKEIGKAIAGKHYDYLLVIRGYMIPDCFILDFKKNNHSAKTIMYQWDSNRTNSFEKVIDCFDKVNSFDYEDCMAFPKINYLPLFATSDIVNLSNRLTFEKDTSNIKFFFMGGYLPERYKALLKFADFAQTSGYSFKGYIYVPLSTLLKEYLKFNFLRLDYASIRHMDRATYLNLLSKSDIIVDVSNRGQTGLAMRIIEGLCLGKKILTDNKNILSDPLYNNQQIAVFNADAPAIDKQFVESCHYDKISVLDINSWIIKLLCDE